MERIVIIGNSGSGKSYLAHRLRDRLGYPLIHLDDLFWEPGGFNKKRPNDVVNAEIARLAQGRNWIVEGVFGELAQTFFPNADYLIWLDLDQETCLNSLKQRGSDSGAQPDQAAAEASFQRLLAWAAAYWERDGLRSWRGHQQLFEAFSASKSYLRSRAAVNAFVTSPLPTSEDDV